MTVGESNDAEQRGELLSLFGVGEDADVVTVSVADTIAAMEGIYDLTGIDSAYSSTALVCRRAGEGLDVTTHNIDVVTPTLYAMALVTAGIGDATLVVGAPANAPAQGMTALTGVFQRWDEAPCASANTTEARRRLALEQLAVTVRAGQEIGDIATVTDLVLSTQQTMITKGLTDAAAIDAALLAQEQAADVVLPADDRTPLVDLLARLGEARLDWGAYAKGWTIKPHATDTGLTMTGTKDAVQEVRAQGSPAAVLEATASAETDVATPAATPPPTATVAAPTATPAPLVVSGKVLRVGANDLLVAWGDGRDAAAFYLVGADATVTRNGKPVGFGEIRKDDTVTLTLPGSGGPANRVVADAPSRAAVGPLSLLWWLLPLGLVVPVAVLLGDRWGQPFVVREVTGDGPVAPRPVLNDPATGADGGRDGATVE